MQFVNRSPKTLLADMRQALKTAGLNTQAFYNISSPVACKNNKLLYLVKLQYEKFAQVYAHNGKPNDPDLAQAVQNAKRANSINQFESMCERKQPEVETIDISIQDPEPEPEPADSVARVEYQASPEFDGKANQELQWLCDTLQSPQLQKKLAEKCVKRYQQRLTLETHVDTKDVLVQKVYDTGLSEYDNFTGGEIKSKCDSLDSRIMEHARKLCAEGGVAQQIAEAVCAQYAGKLCAFGQQSEKQVYPGPDEYYINEALQKEICRLAE